MKLNTKQIRRCIIAILFYMIAILIAIIEYFTMDNIGFLYFVYPIVYPFYYVLVSSIIEDEKNWVIVVSFAVVFVTMYTLKSIIRYNNVCTIISIILLLTELIIAILVKIRDKKISAT